MLKDKIAIVTGGANGLGKETCILFAKNGAKVVIADYNFDAALKVHNEIKELGFDSIPVKVDVADRESVDAMVKEVIDTYGKIDILINNAGITRDSTLVKMTQTQWDQVIATNLTGIFNCCQAVAPHMIEQKYGKIVNTSSVVGTSGNFGQINYAATKAGVIGMTKSLAKELGRKGINVNAIAPGFVATDMVAAMPEKVLNTMVEKIPMQRLGKPIEIANAYMFLASDMASYVNGTTLEVDGAIMF